MNLLRSSDQDSYKSNFENQTKGVYSIVDRTPKLFWTDVSGLHNWIISTGLMIKVSAP